MSATSTPNDSPQPLHQPSKAAHVVVPQAPLGNATNNGLQVPGQGVKALLAKKMASNGNPTFVSPTDNLMTPCSQKLNAAKKKHFTKGSKPLNLFATSNTAEEQDSSDEETKVASEKKSTPIQEDENPF